MFRKLLFALLIVPVFFTACKKNDDPANEFKIAGVQNVTMGSTTELPLTINVSSGNAETVTLSATGLPAGITVSFSPASGTPTFTSVATFAQTGAVTPGTYPIKIVGTSSSFNKSYDLNLVVPVLNGWIANNKVYRTDTIERVLSGGFGVLAVITADSYAEVGFTKMGAWPTADGTYTYAIGDPNTTPTSVEVYFRDLRGTTANTFRSADPGTTMLTVVIAGGKTSITLPATTVSEFTTSTVVTVSASE